MSTKYILSPDGTIIKNDNNTILSGSNLISVVPNLNDKKSRVSEVIENNLDKAFLFTKDLTNTNTFEEGSNDKSDLKDYVIGQSKELINKSFGFINDDLQNIKDEEFKERKYYRSYNSVFDLDLDSNFEGGLQIFANDLDFYGFSPETLKDPSEFADDVIRKILTTIDILIAAALPILTISTLQALIQREQGDISEKRNFELGKYVSYSISNSTNDLDNLNLLALERTLNSFERLMNYPRFKKISFDLGEFIDDIGYFALGFISYILPGLNVKFPNNFDNIKGAKIVSDIISSFTVANQSRHIFNLLVRKIARNNYFLKSYLNSDSLQTTSNGLEVNSFAKNLSYLGSFFYRFVGERVGVGERIYTLQTPRLEKDQFGITRLSETLDVKEEAIELNTNITSFRSSLVKKNDTINQLSIFKMMSENTDLMYNDLNQNGNRIKRLPAERVKMIEEMINADYMPFSIHDIRTNEVFKFHAFIENITDSFTPDYTTSSGFGRMDPVKTYNSTTRSIGVDFWMVSTSREDHNEMWYYINRLVTCLYPLWSKPTVAHPIDSTYAEAHFSRPFTQIPIASPLMRLRIGDILTSNYNRETIKKEIFEIEKKEIKKTTEITPKKAKIISEYFNVLKKYSESDAVKIDNIRNVMLDSNQSYLETFNVNYESESENSSIRNNTVILLKFKDGTLQKLTIKNIKLSDRPKILKDANKLLDQYKFKEKPQINVNEEDDVKTFLYDQKFTYDRNIQTTSSGFKSNVNMITRPNAIVSSYEATKGEGIAGFIKNLNLDHQNSLWDIELGNIAPMMVKISLQFDPIHDIPLGLNYKGGMRAAAYNVGSINKQYFGKFTSQEESNQSSSENQQSGDQQ